jgi:hypothetical protein
MTSGSLATQPTGLLCHSPASEAMPSTSRLPITRPHTSLDFRLNH